MFVFISACVFEWWTLLILLPCFGFDDWCSCGCALPSSLHSTMFLCYNADAPLSFSRLCEVTWTFFLHREVYNRSRPNQSCRSSLTYWTEKATGARKKSCSTCIGAGILFLMVFKFIQHAWHVVYMLLYLFGSLQKVFILAIYNHADGENCWDWW